MHVSIFAARTWYRTIKMLLKWSVRPLVGAFLIVPLPHRGISAVYRHSQSSINRYRLILRRIIPQETTNINI